MNAREMRNDWPRQARTVGGRLITLTPETAAALDRLSLGVARAALALDELEQHKEQGKERVSGDL